MLRVGEHVQVWVTFTQQWSGGFEIADVVDGGYQVRRQSDGMLLPAPTNESDVQAQQVGPWPVARGDV